MFAQINHMAMNSPNWPMMAKFYEAMFGFKPPAKYNRPANGISVGDGYAGLNINPLRDGYVGGLDHFGMVVQNVETVIERARKKFPQANIVKRPSTRPFAQYSAHDPDGNVFDLAQRDFKLDAIYAEQAGQGAEGKLPTPDRYLNKFAIRTPNAEKCAEFYAEVFELQPSNKQGEERGWHLTDGRVTLTILPWSIPIFEGMSIKRPGPDHIGVKVESIAAFTAHMIAVGGSNPYVAAMPLGGSPESDVRKDLFRRAATGKMQIADPGAVWIDITDE
jgi:catechol 2,3-dioxygenase-like lactoylglutathione lyase family enzyme